MTPLIDIVFQLIAFFVFALSFESSPFRVDIDPPRWDGSGTVATATLAVTIELKVGDKAAQRREAFAQIEQADGRQIVVRADENAPFDMVREVLEHLADKEIFNVGLQVTPEDARR